MTRVDFYIVQTTQANGRELLACRLAEKAYIKGHQVYIQVNDSREAERLDKLLWTFRDGSFVPHTLAGGTQTDAPVHIGHGDEPVGHNDVLISLSNEVPLFFSRFQRVAEIVNQDEEQRSLARIRYKFYKERGYPLDTHEITS